VSVTEEGDATLATARDGYRIWPVSVDRSQAAPAAPRLNKYGTSDLYAVGVLRARVAVAATLKGAPLAWGDSVDVEFYDAVGGSSLWKWFDVGEHGVFFLDAENRVADLHYPFLPIAAGLPVPPADLSPQGAVEWLTVQSLRPDTPEPVLASCVEAVIDLGLKEAVAPLRTVVAADDAAIAGDGLWGLVALGDASAVPAAVDFLLNPLEGMKMQHIRLDSAIVMLGDPSLVPAVQPLLASPDRMLRGTALQVLRRMNNPVILPAVVPLLADPDQWVRYQAMMTLAHVTGRDNPEWTVAWPEFQKNPSYYLDKWSNWWETEGKAAYNTTAQSPK